MELTLTRQPDNLTAVNCDNQPSHTFALHTLIPNTDKGPPQPLDDPISYGQALYRALFPPDTLARRLLDRAPKRILLITTDNDLDAIPWEYIYGPYGSEDASDFLILSCHFARGLPADQRIDPPVLDNGLHIVAIPSNPLSQAVEPLNIDGEWLRLKEIIQQVPSAITLERTRPPTVEQVHSLVANQRNRVVHFMGHGGQHETGAILCFEQENGGLDPVTAKQFVQRVRGTVFLVTLNACVSATPGATTFSNLAAALVQQKVPYALGMRFSILDDDARAFSRAFYNDLARGTSVEEALLQARLTLANTPRSWAVGVPVLYTALKEPTTGFASIAGTPTIKEHQPHIEASALPRAEGTFQGRIEDLQQLGTALTGDSRPRIVTIHGGGGQGKTALAREAVERFAHAWPGGVWATTLENLPDRAAFAADLARFLGIATQEILDPNEVERMALAKLAIQRTLIVLDNAETLVDAVMANDAKAVLLAQFIQQLPTSSTNLLVTSRVQLQWSGELSLELGGLTPTEGATLFRQSAPQRADEAEQVLAEGLSQKLEGHPLSLRLLGGAFNASAISLRAFIQDCDRQLTQAENKYLGEEHRHRSLYACIETSVRYLDANLRALLSGLWVFHAPFLAETAAAIFDPEAEDTEETPAPIHNSLHTLWQRGLLVRETATVRDGTLQFYHLLPTMRPYVEKHLEQAYQREILLLRFGAVYFRLASFLHRELNRSAVAVAIAQQAREDLERGVICIAGIEQGYYLLHWGWALQRLGNPRHGIELTERAREIAQEGKDRSLDLAACNNIALVYQATGKSQEALQLYQQALPIRREVGDRAGEAATLNNMAEVYSATGQPQKALRLLQQALPISREVGDRAGEAATLNNIAELYRATGQPQEALRLLQQALPIRREVGDRAGEATTLNNMAGVYSSIGQPQEALRLLQQALPIKREVGDRAGEAATLNNIALVYSATGRPQEALRLLQQALLITHEVGDRVGEAATLNNLAGVYSDTRQPQEALRLLQQALPIKREVGDRAGEAATLNNLAAVYSATGRPQKALRLLQQALLIRCEVGVRAGEANTLSNMAILLYQHLNRSEDAISYMEQAIAVLEQTGLPQDAAGSTKEDLQRYLQIMRTDAPPGPHGDDLPFDAELIPRSITALLGGPQEKMAHVQYLATLSAQATDEGMKALLDTIQLALFDGDLSQTGQNLSGVYRQAWESIVARVKTEGGTLS